MALDGVSGGEGELALELFGGAGDLKQYKKPNKKQRYIIIVWLTISLTSNYG